MNAIDYTDDGHQQQVEDSDDDEMDNRRIADQYNRELAEMTASGSQAFQRPAVKTGKMELFLWNTVLFLFIIL